MKTEIIKSDYFHKRDKRKKIKNLTIKRSDYLAFNQILEVLQPLRQPYFKSENVTDTEGYYLAEKYNEISNKIARLVVLGNDYEQITIID